ncbi:SDR family NAD(P)-dependent oxidoreductase [Novosphingobium organovorum]|nr:SDR family NAD(P)-dependent oxidoreductase [Novosphingobium organovorum]
MDAVHRIYISGASGGLGRALALHHARPGVALWLWGRNPERLDALAEACRAAGAEACVRALPLDDTARAIAALEHEDAAARFDLAYLVAGQGDTRSPGATSEDPMIVARLIRINLEAPAAMATVLARRMGARGGGRIVLIGSAAAFHALPFATAYAASKAGLARFADALRIAARPLGVAVTLASPGFIDTPAGRRIPGGKPMVLTPEEAARRIAHAASRRQAHLVTPRAFALLRLFDRALPRPWRDRLLRALAPPG